MSHSDRDQASTRTLLASNPLGATTTLDDVIENFEFLDDWESRYGYVIDLGKLAPALPAEFRVESNQVLGCQSQVWFIADIDPVSGQMLVLVDSDALIVRGLAAVVMAALNRQSPASVAHYDMEALFQRLDLIRHLSPTRGNGLRAMVQRIQDRARTLTRASSDQA